MKSTCAYGYHDVVYRITTDYESDVYISPILIKCISILQDLAKNKKETYFIEIFYLNLIGI